MTKPEPDAPAPSNAPGARHPAGQTAPRVPTVIFSAAMTLDGKIASRTGDADLSDETDWREVHALRRACDAVMVGVGTVLKDDPKLRLKYHAPRPGGYPTGAYPARVVVDSTCRTPPSANVVTFEPARYATIVGTTARAPAARRARLESAGVEVVVAGAGPRVDLPAFLRALYDRGLRRVMLEGGGTLAWGMVAADLVDEVRVFVAPVLCGGTTATSLVAGEGFARISGARRFQLVEARSRGDHVILTYRRERAA